MADKALRRRRPSSSYIRAIDGDVVANVKVVVRIRPPNAAEQTDCSNIVVHQINENVLVFDPLEQSRDGTFQKGPRDIRKRRNKDIKFAFDYIFGLNSSNSDVFEQTTKTILDGLLQGYNSSVFAYGATGAGKTYTMLGNAKQPGVVYHTMIDLYNRIANMQDEKTCSVAVSYLEVYNEQIRDLLIYRGSGCLPVREDPKLGVVITGLSLHKPTSAEELLHMLQFGNKNRTQHPTDANAESSRSHAVFQVFIRQKEKTANISAEVRVAKMCMVDLAGSERATVTKNRGSRFREGANINRSLLALGNVINALADNKNKGFIPYRDSKLTRLLKDSLGGNCRTVMIAAVSPSSYSYEDTYNTLKYADRAKHIQATLKKNILNVDFHVSRYGKIVEELRMEISSLKERVKKYEEGKVVAVQRISCHTDVFRLQDVLHKLFSSRVDIRIEHLNLESAYRDRLLRIYRKEKCLLKLQMVTDTQNGVISKIQKHILTTKSKLENLEKKKAAAAVKFDENSCWLKQVESEMLLAGGGQAMPEMLEVSLRMHRLEVELGDTRQHVKHLRKLVRVQERDAQTNDRLVMSLLSLVKKQHFVLKGHGLMTSDMTSEYDGILRSVEHPEVTWADEVKDTSNDTQFNVDKVVELPILEPLPIKCGTPSRIRKNNQCSTPGVSNKFMSTIDVPHSPLDEHSGSGDPVNPQRVLQPSGNPGVPARVVSGKMEYADQRARSNSVSEQFIVSQGFISQPVSVTKNVDHTVPQKADSLTCLAGHTPAAKKLSIVNVLPESGTLIRSVPNATGNEKQVGGMKPHLEEEFKETSNDLNSTFTLDIPHQPCTPTVSGICVDRTVNTGIYPVIGAGDSCTRTSNCWTQNVSQVMSHSTASAFPSSVANRSLNCLQSSAPGFLLKSDSFAQNSVLSPISSSSSQELNGAVSITKTCNPSNCALASQTVTKAAPSVIVGKENAPAVADIMKGDKKVVRCINFESVTCTPDRTYAQVLKTPTPERSALAPLSNNTPTPSPQVMPRNLLYSDGTPVSKSREDCHRLMNPKVLHRSNQQTNATKENIQALHKMGLPSLALNIQKSASRPQCAKPSYMQMTKSATQRSQKVPVQPESDHIPLFKRRSKSTSSLNRYRWQH